MIQKKRINLFAKTTRSPVSFFLTEKAILYASSVGILLFIVFLIFIVLSIAQKNRINGLLNQKQGLLNYIVENKNNEVETTYFLLKKEQLKKFLKEDAEFLPYYKILDNSIKSSSNAAVVQSLTIDKNKQTQFSIQFLNYESMYNFFKFIESDIFLKNFEMLELTAFSLSAQKESTKGYMLNFQGKFRILSDKEKEAQL